MKGTMRLSRDGRGQFLDIEMSLLDNHQAVDPFSVKGVEEVQCYNGTLRGRGEKKSCPLDRVVRSLYTSFGQPMAGTEADGRVGLPRFKWLGNGVLRRWR